MGSNPCKLKINIIMSEKIRKLVHREISHFSHYILEESNIILEEQRKISVQISLQRACRIIRGSQINKRLLSDFVNAIDKIRFKETPKTKKFKQEIYEAYKIYNDYYTDRGVRKLSKIQ